MPENWLAGVGGKAQKKNLMAKAFERNSYGYPNAFETNWLTLIRFCILKTLLSSYHSILNCSELAYMGFTKGVFYDASELSLFKLFISKVITENIIIVFVLHFSESFHVEFSRE